MHDFDQKYRSGKKAAYNTNKLKKHNFPVFRILVSSGS